MNGKLDVALVALQAFDLLFLLLHDWVPMGRLNNLTAIRREDSMARSLFVTLLPAVPCAIGLYCCARFLGRPYPSWLATLLWATYGTLLVGVLRAWWIPYLLVPEPERAARYRTIFAGTYRFLPQRNGMAPDTLHVSFHVALVATAVLLILR
jgi:hypothetical protein